MQIALFFDAAIAIYKRWRWLLPFIPLLGLIAFLWIKLYGFLWWDGAIEQRDKALTQVVEMRAASEQARKDQLALNAANQELLQRIADNAAQRHVETKRATDRAIADYASSHRMRQDSACRPGKADPAPMHPDPGTPAGPDGSELVAVPRADFEAIARDAVRGREAQAFLIDLVNGGLAVVVPEPEFGR